MEKETKKKTIRSEMTHTQEISIIHPMPSEELIEQIRCKLIALREEQGSNGKEDITEQM